MLLRVARAPLRGLLRLGHRMVDGKAPQVKRVRCIRVRRGRAPDGRVKHGAVEGEALGPARRGLEARERRLLVAATLGMPYVVRARARRALPPRVQHVESERMVDA